MDGKGIILELQWKKKHANRSGADHVSNIGVCYLAEPSADLDWMSFKSYLCQNIGTKSDVTFAYVDSEGDEIPIESEMEFREAVKFARQRARRGKAILLKLDRPNHSDTSNASSNVEKPPLSIAPKSQKTDIAHPSGIQKNAKSYFTKTFSKTATPTEKSEIKGGVAGVAQKSNNKEDKSEDTTQNKLPLWFDLEKDKIRVEVVTEIGGVLEAELNKILIEIRKVLRTFEKACVAANTELKKRKTKMADKVPSNVGAAVKRSAVDGKEIMLKLQLKKKGPLKNGQDETSTIDVCYLAEPSPNLTWKSFKSFLCQTVGTEEEVAISYVDSDGSQIPIASECELKGALKFACDSAKEGRPITLIVERAHDVHTCGANAEKLPEVGKAEETPDVTVSQQTKVKIAYSEDAKDTSAPSWFEKEKEKMKSEMIAEVKSQIKQEIQQALIELKKTLGGSDRILSDGALETTCTRKKKKKVSDEDSSDANAVEQREYKLLRKLEKLHKREKKLEKKLDSKLEKLETKTKRLLEKKMHSKSRSDTSYEQNSLNRKRSEVSVGTYLMDAILLNSNSQPDVHIKVGVSFTKVWQIMNNGTLPWTDKTELRLAWGTTGLEPQVTTVTCPTLEPGEHGQISVTFKAPEFAGTFESYWHFYHMGVRFGHWISCAVIVDPKEGTDAALKKCDGRPKADNQVEGLEMKTRNDHAVDLTVRSKSEESDLEVISNFEKDNESCRDAEYESDSDSDNVSVISNDGSVSSESDDADDDDDDSDDKFVVVSMPASSTTEGNLGGSGDSNITELSYPELIAGTMTTGAVAGGTNTVTSVITTDASMSSITTTAPTLSAATPPSNDLMDTYIWPGSNGSESTGVKDYNNQSASVKPSSFDEHDKKVNNLTYGHEVTPQMNFVKSHFEEAAQSTSENATDKPSFDLNQTAKTNENLKNIVFAVDMLGRTVPVKLNNKPRKQNSNGASPQSSGNYPDVCPIAVEESEEAHPDQNYTSSNPGNDFRSGTASNYLSAVDNTQQRNNEAYAETGGNIIHILPETLMNGAVNVATSAISTARAVISNLRTIPSRTGVEVGSPADQSHLSVTSQSLEFILEMGFTDKERILTLLKQHNNDISKVVSELILPAEANYAAV